MNLTRLITYIGLLLILASCGKKGPVRPLDVSLPGPVQNAELRQRGNELLLSWQLPTSNQDGSPLTSAPEVDIYRMLFDPNDDCPECEDRSSPRYTINPELPQPAWRSGDRYLLRDQQVAENQGYQYRLVPRSEDDQNGQPLRMRVVYIEPSAAPAGFSVESHDRSATLSWLPLEPAGGQVLTGYQVYRRTLGGSQPAELLVQLPPENQKYDDLTLTNGKQYAYQIRALLTQGEQFLESLPTPAITATPQAGQ